MKIGPSVLFFIFVLCGCAHICEFGESDTSSGLKCHRVVAKAEIGMTRAEAEKKLGSPQRRQIDVSYRGKTYDEVWVYETVPPTVLYFKNGILEEKEYQQ
ncbi:MAG TPA: hypothetical protein DCL35_02780 [Candidatus Omnitrophica bacterium]|nr:hypothetical protein [Candidatus Omnitrophota bacterium]